MLRSAVAIACGLLVMVACRDKQEQSPTPPVDRAFQVFQQKATCAELGLKFFEVQKSEHQPDKMPLFNPRYNYDTQRDKCFCRVSFGGPARNSGAIIYDVFTAEPIATWEQDSAGAKLGDVTWEEFHKLELSMGVAWSKK